MAHDLSEAAAQFAELARNLILVGSGELRDELYRAINDAADPLVKAEESLPRIRAYMPNRYADLFAQDLKISVFKRTTGADAGVNIVGRAPTVGRGGRKVAQRNTGIIWHPVFAQGPRRSWRWKLQTAGMRPGWFTDPAEAAAPQVREKILEAIRRIEDKATGKG